jgi:hypothetical protein
MNYLKVYSYDGILSNMNTAQRLYMAKSIYDKVYLIVFNCNNIHCLSINKPNSEVDIYAYIIPQFNIYCSNIETTTLGNDNEGIIDLTILTVDIR